MTYKQKYNENKKLIKNYIKCLDYCKDFDSRLKLITEIGRLNQQNKAIEKMTFEEVKRDSNDYIVEVNAII